MNAKYSSVVLFVEDIERAKTFYVGFMNLKIEMDMGTNVILQNGITLWQVDPEHIIPQTIGIETTRAISNRFELYFETENLLELMQGIELNKIPLVHGLHEEPWGQKTVRIYDPDRNIVEIGETMKSFLSRMKTSGMSIEQISKKTGMTAEDIVKTMS